MDETNRTGIWSQDSGVLTLVARLGSAAPATDPDVLFYFDFGDIAFSGKGDSAFVGYLSTPGISEANASGVWSGRGNNLRVVARKGAPAAGMNPGVNYAYFLSASPSINDAGQVAFSGAGVIGSGDERVFVSGIWSEGSGSLQLVAAEGMAAPNLESGVTFDSFGPPEFNNAGETAFWTHLQGPGIDASNAVSIWLKAAGGLRLVARTGSAPPDMESGIKFSRFEGPTLNGAGQVAFRGTLTGGNVGTSNDTGIWSEGGVGLHLVAREGSHAPGTQMGISFADFGGSLTFFNNLDPSMNGAGQTAFWALLTGAGVNSTNDLGIWAEGPNGLELVAREGDLFEVVPGDFRTIAFVAFAGDSGNEDGHRSAFNDRGQLVFSASFTDGSSGIFVANVGVVPEPRSMWWLAIIVAGIVRRNTRR